jgi:hypothetical protein
MQKNKWIISIGVCLLLSLSTFAQTTKPKGPAKNYTFSGKLEGLKEGKVYLYNNEADLPHPIQPWPKMESLFLKEPYKSPCIMFLKLKEYNGRRWGFSLKLEL